MNISEPIWPEGKDSNIKNKTNINIKYKLASNIERQIQSDQLEQNYNQKSLDRFV